EELLGAVNRCWKCGQVFVRRPEADGLPPVRMERAPAAAEPLEAIVLDDGPAGGEATGSATTTAVAASPVEPPVAPRVAPLVQYVPKPIAPPVSTAQVVEARRKGMMAMGGTIAAILLGVFALILSFFRAEAAVIALLGLCMGIWGLYSPRRSWALVGVLLCCLAIGLGVYRGANDLYIYIKNQQPVQIEEATVEDSLSE
ncbi:MAG TPA: hypothetical protein VFV87_19905, partial [Pirellulaceae bacterium]|nr:hypothetical protein [Pirellulaceae bacterium]